MIKLFQHLKEIWNLPSRQSRDAQCLMSRIDECHARIGKHTTVHADIHYREQSQIIVIGKYRNHDYVRCFNYPQKDLKDLIDMLHDKEKYSKVGYFDTPHSYPFSIVYKHDKF